MWDDDLVNKQNGWLPLDTLTLYNYNIVNSDRLDTSWDMIHFYVI